jgi:2OG-Fe(II) oxygenase superfamily
MVTRSQFESSGYQVFDEFLSPKRCSEFLENVESYREQFKLPEIYRPMKTRSLRYNVIDGDRIKEHLAEIWSLYQGKMIELVNGLTPQEFVPLDNTKVGVNVNVMPPGRSEYRWHYDRNAVTCILYLNAIEGGETILYPNYRILLGNRGRMFAQQMLDSFLHTKVLRRIFGKKTAISPRPGRLAIMRGNQCWHSVRSVEGKQDRINIICAYDLPGAQFPMEESLDSYIYTQEEMASSDPNYG